jgi:hypothetical protein
MFGRLAGEPSAKAAANYTEVSFPIVDGTILTNTIDIVNLSTLWFPETHGLLTIRDTTTSMSESITNSTRFAINLWPSGMLAAPDRAFSSAKILISDRRNKVLIEMVENL